MARDGGMAIPGKKHRTPIRQRSLPDYTRIEERMNMSSHIVGGALGVFVLVVCILTAVGHGDVLGIVCGCVYGVSMILLYTASSVYHGMRPCTGKKVMQVIDHCTIYLLIAGTYTPLLLTALRPLSPALAWTLFGVEWGLAILAATLTAIDLKKYSRFSMVCYIITGWLVVVAIGPVIEAISLSGFWWLLAGGIAYTVGAVLYNIGKKKPYFHTIFHLFVLIGSALHAVCVVGYAM